MQDEFVDFDQYTEMEDNSLFDLVFAASRPREYDEDFVMGITIEMSPDLKVISRQTYSILDLLSDFGGVQSVLISAFGIILSLLNYRHAENYMASKLYKIRREGWKGKSGYLYTHSDFFKPSKLDNLKHCLIKSLP